MDSLRSFFDFKPPFPFPPRGKAGFTPSPLGEGRVGGLG